MAGKTIGQLAELDSLSGNEEIPVEVNGLNKKVKASLLKSTSAGEVSSSEISSAEKVIQEGATMQRLLSGGKPIYPATTTNAVVDKNSKKTVAHKISELDSKIGIMNFYAELTTGTSVEYGLIFNTKKIIISNIQNTAIIDGNNISVAVHKNGGIIGNYAIPLVNGTELNIEEENIDYLRLYTLSPKILSGGTLSFDISTNLYLLQIDNAKKIEDNAKKINENTERIKLVESNTILYNEITYNNIKDGYVMPKQDIGSEIKFGDFSQCYVYNIEENIPVKVEAIEGGSYGFALCDENNIVLEYFNNSSFIEYVFSSYSKKTILYTSKDKTKKVFIGQSLSNKVKENELKIQSVEQSTDKKIQDIHNDIYIEKNTVGEAIIATNSYNVSIN